MKLVYFFVLGLIVMSCKGHRDLKEYSLDEKSFDLEAIEKIERELGIEFPKNVKGIAFHHIPPIDPIVFAKIRIPHQGRDSMIRQVKAWKKTQIPEDFANDCCQWWLIESEEVIFSKQAFQNGYYTEIHLIKNQADSILYVKYFTM